LGFYVLALLIVEATLSVIIVGSNIEPKEKFWGVILVVAMFVLVVGIVTVLVWFKAENLTFDREAHLSRAKLFGSEAHQLKAAELENLSTNPARKTGESHD